MPDDPRPRSSSVEHPRSPSHFVNVRFPKSSAANSARDMGPTMKRATVASCGTLLPVPWSAVVLGLGALVYAGLIGPLGLTFDATPLLLGSIALAAALLGRTPRLTATALTLIGWGAAVMLTSHGPLPDEREAAAFLVGAGLGLLTARLVAGGVPSSMSARGRPSWSWAVRRSSSPSMRTGSTTGPSGARLWWDGPLGVALQPA